MIPPYGDIVPGRAKPYVFTGVGGTGTSNLSSFQVWHRPKGCRWVYLFGIGGAGGGGGPNNAATIGGGGGGSAAITSVLIPAWKIPEVLFVGVGAGGAGRTQNNGLLGTDTIVSAVDGVFTGQNLVLRANRGAGGNGAASNTGGAAGAVNTGSQMVLSELFYSTAGSGIGGAGAAAANTAGSAATVGNTGSICKAGSGGGHGTGAGGNLTGTGIYITRTGGAGTTGGNGDHGQNHNANIHALITSGAPLVFSGGAGGGGSSAGTAGDGGSGGIGCGGGGGGGGPTGGRGGDGGPGLVIIWAW